MFDNLKGLHIELTNLCTLKCPRCSRTEFIKQFPNKWTNKNLDLENLKRFLNIDLNNKLVYLCGNYGDTIYYDRLFEAVEYFKQQGARLKIATNGSYRKKEWWEELASLLTADDEVVFAIDGLPENFTTYRINADWTSIKVGIEVIKNSPAKMSWQYILFSFNEHLVDQAKALSEDLGFDNFFVMQSDRWDHGSELLTPSNAIAKLNEAKINWKIGNTTTEIDPLCSNNSQHFISADGFYTPCCWSAEHRWYYKTDFYKDREKYDISKTTLQEVLVSLKDFYSTIKDAKLAYCTFNCPKL